MIGPILTWIGRRLICSALGHRLETARIMSNHSHRRVNGYRCNRCGKKQEMLWPWQVIRVKNGEE